MTSCNESQKITLTELGGMFLSEVVEKLISSGMGEENFLASIGGSVSSLCETIIQNDPLPLAASQTHSQLISEGRLTTWCLQASFNSRRWSVEEMLHSSKRETSIINLELGICTASERL